MTLLNWIVWDRIVSLSRSLDHLTSDIPKWEIKSHLNQSSVHIVHFLIRQLDLVFTPKFEITGPADYSIIKRKKLTSRERKNTEFNDKIIMFLTSKRTINNFEILVFISMSNPPKIRSRMSQNLAPILRRPVQVHAQSSPPRPTKYSQSITLILIFSLLKQEIWGDLVISESGARIFSRVLLPVSICPPLSLTTTVAFRQNPKQLFLLFPSWCISLTVFN